jgi:RNA polymerase primary sigma factor
MRPKVSNLFRMLFGGFVNAFTALAEQSRIVRLPLNKIGALNKINRAFTQLEQEHEREPSPDEVAEMLDLPEDKIASTL